MSRLTSVLVDCVLAAMSAPRLAHAANGTSCLRTSVSAPATSGSFARMDVSSAPMYATSYAAP